MVLKFSKRTIHIYVQYDSLCSEFAPNKRKWDGVVQYGGERWVLIAFANNNWK